MNRFFCLVLLAAVLLAGSACADTKNPNPFVSPRGSCNYIDGVTVIVTIFVDDPYHRWDWGTREEDAASYFRIRSRMETACRWLTQQAGRYGAHPVFHWDWHTEKYLYNWFTSEKDMRNYDNTYWELNNYIRGNIPLREIRDYYGADNILFNVLYNQDLYDTARGVSFPLDFSPGWENRDDAFELLWIMDEDNGLTVSAAGLAHEIMHCFGAVDLYDGSPDTTAAYVKYLNSIRSNDIMFSIDYRDPDHIGESFSDLDAYYLGLRSSNPDQQKYGLPASSFSR